MQHGKHRSQNKPSQYWRPEAGQFVWASNGKFGTFVKFDQIRSNSWFMIHVGIITGVDGKDFAVETRDIYPATKD